MLIRKSKKTLIVNLSLLVAELQTTLRPWYLEKVNREAEVIRIFMYKISRQQAIWRSMHFKEHPQSSFKIRLRKDLD